MGAFVEEEVDGGEAGGEAEAGGEDLEIGLDGRDACGQGACGVEG